MKAFPIKGWNGYEETIHEGMELRDYFAAKMIPRFSFRPYPLIDAKECYKIADAMMEARK